MKKLIAILVVFAIFAGAAFAQEGSWTLGGSGILGTQFDFKDPIDSSTVGGDRWGDGGPGRGGLDLTYTRGIVKTGLNFSTQDAVGAFVEANGENWNFRAKTAVWKIIDGPAASVDDLWGNFKFVDVLEGLFIEAALAKGGQQWNAENLFNDTFTHDGRIGKDYFLFDLTAATGITFGFKLPGIFTGAAGNTKLFVGDAFANIVVGAKFDIAPVLVALQFASNPDSKKASGDNTIIGQDYGIRAQVKFTINDAMWAAVDFKGGFGTGDAQIAVGGKFNLSVAISDTAALDAGLTVKFGNNGLNGSSAGSSNFTIDLSVPFTYKIDPDSLQLKITLDLGIALPEGGDLGLTYKLTPEINYNFLGTGSSNWDTGLAVRYIIGGNLDTFGNTNSLEVCFKWKF